jgi:L-amino acid N-acyltransferase
LQDVRIRLAGPDDLEAINAIYNHYVVTSTATFQDDPSTPAERAEWFAHHGADLPVTVAEVDGEVAGWASLSRFHTRCAYRHTVEASIYIRHDRLGMGLGRALLADLVERGRAAGHHSIIGLICTESVASLRLFESHRFARVAHLREVGHKAGRWLDVVYVQLML